MLFISIYLLSCLDFTPVTVQRLFISTVNVHVSADLELDNESVMCL